MCKLALFDSEVEMQYLGFTGPQGELNRIMTASIYYRQDFMRGPFGAIGKMCLASQRLWDSDIRR